MFRRRGSRRRFHRTSPSAVTPTPRAPGCRGRRKDRLGDGRVVANASCVSIDWTTSVNPAEREVQESSTSPTSAARAVGRRGEVNARPQSASTVRDVVYTPPVQRRSVQVWTCRARVAGTLLHRDGRAQYSRALGTPLEQLYVRAEGCFTRIPLGRSPASQEAYSLANSGPVCEARGSSPSWVKNARHDYIPIAFEYRISRRRVRLRNGAAAHLESRRGDLLRGWQGQPRQHEKHRCRAHPEVPSVRRTTSAGESSRPANPP